jgi:hypothetical protein
MLLAILALLWHAFPVTSMILLAPYGKKWEGFYTSLFFGPIGLMWALSQRKKLEAERRALEPPSM